MSESGSVIPSGWRLRPRGSKPETGNKIWINGEWHKLTEAILTFAGNIDPHDLALIEREDANQCSH